MFCERCGYLLEDGEKVCSKCGTPVQGAENATIVPTDSATVSNDAVTVSNDTATASTDAATASNETTATSAYTAPNTASAYTTINPSAAPAGASTPAAKKFNVAGLVLGIVGAIGIVALIVVAVNFSAIDNFIHKTFYTPEGYYKYVEKKAIKELASTAGEWYDAYVLDEMTMNDMSIEQQLSVEISEGGQSVLSLARLMGVDLTWFKSGTISVETSCKDDIFAWEGYAALNQQNILSGNFIMDMQGESMYFQIPELTETYLGMDMEDVLDADEQDFIQEFQEQFALNKQLTEIMPDQKTVEKLTNKYLLLMLDCVEDVTKDTDTLKIGGVSQKVTVLTATIDDEAMQDIWKVILEEVRKDQDIKKIVTDLAKVVEPEIDEDAAYESFLEELEDKAEEADEYFFEYVKKTMVMTVYVDYKGKIRGRSIEWVEDVSAYGDAYTNSMTVSVLMPEKGNRFGYEMEVVQDMESSYGSDMNLKISGSGNRSGNKTNGDFTMDFNGISILDLTVKNIDTKKLKMGQLDGTIEIQLADTLGVLLGYVQGMSVFEDMKFVLTADAEKNTTKMTFDFFFGEEQMVSVTASEQTKDKANISIPADEDIIMVQDEYDFEEWLDEIDWDEVISQLSETDLPSSLIDMVEELAEELQYMDLDWMDLPDIGMYNNIL